VTYVGSEHESLYKKLLEREGYPCAISIDSKGRRHWYNAPHGNTLATARRIRQNFGWGGCNFPGAKQLYEAATLIEGWQADCEAAKKPVYEPGPVPGSLW
jgi:hypothetical protein